MSSTDSNVYYDVYFGRGNKSNQMRKGTFYQQLIDQHWATYLSTKSSEESNSLQGRDFVQKHIVQPIRVRGGRFLRPQGEFWEQVESEDEIIKKIMQALRDRKRARSRRLTPENETQYVQPFDSNHMSFNDADAVRNTTMSPPTESYYYAENDTPGPPRTEEDASTDVLDGPFQDSMRGLQENTTDFVSLDLLPRPPQVTPEQGRNLDALLSRLEPRVREVEAEIERLTQDNESLRQQIYGELTETEEMV